MTRQWKKSGLTWKIAAEIVLLAIVLLVIDVLMQDKMNALVNALTEQGIALKGCVSERKRGDSCGGCAFAGACGDEADSFRV